MSEVKKEEIGRKQLENLTNHCILMIEKQVACKIPDNLLSYHRLKNHINDMIIRCMKQEELEISINERAIKIYC